MHSACWSHFPASVVQNVLKWVHKDFSQARFSYFLPLHFPNCSSTTFAGWLWNIVTVKEWHFSAGVVQIVLKRVHKDFSQAGFSYFWPLHFPNYSSTTSAIYFLKQSSFKGQVWNLSNHKKQSEQFWSMFLKAWIWTIIKINLKGGIWAIVYSNLSNVFKGWIWAQDWDVGLDVLLLLRHNHRKVISVHCSGR